MHDPAAACLTVIVALLVLFIWLYLIAAHGGYWRVRPVLARPQALLENLKIVAVVPARDEAGVIAQSLQSLLTQDLPQPIQVIVVDDNSSDGTAETAMAAARAIGAEGRLSVINGRTLPPGWTGKLWALQQGIERCASFDPNYLLFTDADVFHNPGSIGTLAAFTHRRQLDLASYMVKLQTATWAERLLIPGFVYFFFQLYPPAFIGNQHRRIAGAAGGCILVRPDALIRAGGIAAIRSEVIDDCAMARIVKRSGGHLSLQLTTQSRSLRSYGGFAGVGKMIARSAFFQLRHSFVLLAGTLLGLFAVYCAPVALLFVHDAVARLCGALALLLMFGTFLPLVRFYRQSSLLALLLPVVAVFYAAATVYSAYAYITGSGGQWKGRAQDSA